MTTFLNENDPNCVAWLSELIRHGHLPAATIDPNDIELIDPGSLDSFTQCHFFAGIGGWLLALRLAGWPADRSVWTGSCPCQPFSVAGKRAAASDPRHLWPAFDLLHMLDGRSRRVEPGTAPLVARLPRGLVPGGDPSVEEAQASAEARAMRLRGYGNSIVPALAAEFIRAVMELL